MGFLPRVWGCGRRRLSPGGTKPLLSSTKLHLLRGDGEGPPWPTQRPRVKWHVPRAVAKEVDGPELAGRQGGQNHVASHGR